MFATVLTRLTRRSALAVLAAAALAAPLAARADVTPPDALIKQVSTDVIDSVKADKAIQAGDVSRISALVDSKVMPHVNFQRMTAAAVGRNWRSATPEQQQRLKPSSRPCCCAPIRAR